MLGNLIENYVKNIFFTLEMRITCLIGLTFKREFYIQSKNNEENVIINYDPWKDGLSV